MLLSTELLVRLCLQAHRESQGKESFYSINTVQVNGQDKHLIVSFSPKKCRCVASVAVLRKGPNVCVCVENRISANDGSVCVCLSPQLHEIDVDVEFVRPSDASCDVACLLYDVTDHKSFNYCASVYKVTSSLLAEKCRKHHPPKKEKGGKKFTLSRKQSSQGT